MDLWSTGVEVRLITPGAIDTEIWDQPGNDPAPYDGPARAAGRRWPPRSATRSIGDRFETYVPDLKAVAEFKTSDIDAYLASAVAFLDRTDEERPIVKALQFLTEPEPWPEPLPDDAPLLLRNLAPCRWRWSTSTIRRSWPTTGWCCRNRLTGICGSDSKQVLMDFDDADDNPMTAFISFPQVLGHEVVGIVDTVGPAVRGLDRGQRVVLYPNLGCRPRGSPRSARRASGATTRSAATSTRAGCRPASTPATRSRPPAASPSDCPRTSRMAFAVPDAIADEVAVLADPWSVSFHAITRNPPAPGSKVIVYGAGALGTTATAILRQLYPTVEVATIARWPAQADAGPLAGRRGVRPGTARGS